MKINEFLSNEYFLDFSASKFDEIVDYLNEVCWAELFHRKNLDDAVDLLHKHIDQAIDKFVPKVKRRNPKYPPWFNSNLIKLRNKKNKFYYKMKNCTNSSQIDDMTTSFRNARKLFDSALVESYNEYVENTEVKIKNNPKRFWAFVNTKRKTSGYPSIMCYKNEKLMSPESICQRFADFFKSSYNSNTADNLDKSISSNCLPALIPNLIISYADIAESIADMNDGMGPDGIPSSFLKHTAEALIDPLLIIFNKSLKTGYFPNAWKISHSVPIYKSGDRTDIENYRSITNISSIPKLFESIVSKYLSFHLKDKISSVQHGFVKGRSTTTNLIEFQNVAANVIESGKQLDTIYIDFSKAFDSLHHDITISKLMQFGFTNIMLIWLKSYLMNRHQFVKLNDYKSNLFDVMSGVPQGSHLGPLIFIMFINDIVSCFDKVQALLFADDLKAFMEINSVYDALQLQNDLNKLMTWCHKNMLYVNIKKCKVMSLYRKQSPIEFEYKIDSQIIDRVSHFTDLGVIIDRKLVFNAHIDKICLKANKMLGFLMRIGKEFKDISVLIQLFYTLVRSQLEYAIVVWQPSQQYLINRIEQIQKKFLYYLYKKLGFLLYDSNIPMWNQIKNLPPYAEQCDFFGVVALEKRRQICSCLFVSDILMGRIDCTNILASLNIYVPTRNIRRREFLKIKHHSTSYGMRESLTTISRSFNSVYEHFDFHLSRDLFRNNLMHN